MKYIYSIIFTIFLIFSIFLINNWDLIEISKIKWVVYLNYLYMYIFAILFVSVSYKIRRKIINKKEKCKKNKIIKNIIYFLIFIFSLYSTFFIAQFITTFSKIQKELLDKEIQLQIESTKKS